jgi:hypothetical protein
MEIIKEVYTMKKRMKRMGALLLTLAMILSLSVSASASLVGSDSTVGTTVGDTSSVVSTEGGLPVDVTTVVLPTTSAGQFSMIFDSHGLLHETTAVKYEGTNNGGDVTDVDDSRFFFKVYTETAVDEKDTSGSSPKPYALKADFGSDPNVIPAGTEVVKYLKAATIGKIYATGSTQGKDFKWMKVTDATHVDEVTDADFGTGQAYEKIASLKGLDPAIGYGLDAIAKLNKNNPNLYLKKAAAAFADVAAVKAGTIVTDDDEAAKLVNAVEYTFVATYASGTGANDNCYIYFVNGTATKFFKNLGTTTPTAPAEVDTPAAADASGLADFVDDADTTQNVAKAVLTVGSGDSAVTFYRQRENKNLLSLKATSAPVTVINKTNADIGVSMSAKLENLKGGDGSKPTGGDQTYVYAKDYDPATGKFYDDVATATTRNVIQGGNDGVPVFYLALKNATDTEVMAYDSEEDEATVSIGAAIKGSPDFFRKNWTTDLNHDGTANDEGYEYEIKPEALPKREADFQSMTFNLFGAIDADNNVWNSFGTTTPNVTVTWKVVAIQPLDAPTITKPASVSTKAAATFQITNTDDKLILVGVKQGTTEIAADKLTVVTTADNGTTSVTIAKGVATGTQDLVFTFKHPTETYRTKDVTVSFS